MLCGKALPLAKQEEENAWKLLPGVTFFIHLLHHALVSNDMSPVSLFKVMASELRLCVKRCEGTDTQQILYSCIFSYLKKKKYLASNRILMLSSRWVYDSSIPNLLLLCLWSKNTTIMSMFREVILLGLED